MQSKGRPSPRVPRRGATLAVALSLAGCAAGAPDLEPIPSGRVARSSGTESLAQTSSIGTLSGDEEDPSRSRPARAPRAQTPPPHDPRLDANIMLEVWCQDLGKAYCTHCQPTQYASCMGSFHPACLAQRPRTMVTDRTARHVLECSMALVVASCTEVSAGRLPAPCRPLRRGNP